MKEYIQPSLILFLSIFLITTGFILLYKKNTCEDSTKDEKECSNFWDYIQCKNGVYDDQGLCSKNRGTFIPIILLIIGFSLLILSVFLFKTMYKRICYNYDYYEKKDNAWKQYICDLRKTVDNNLPSNSIELGKYQTVSQYPGPRNPDHQVNLRNMLNPYDFRAFNELPFGTRLRIRQTFNQ
jgi:hypothetical protein